MYMLSERQTGLKQMKTFVDEMMIELEIIRDQIENKMNEFERCLEGETNDLEEQIGWYQDDIDALDAGANDEGLGPCPFCGEVIDIRISYEKLKNDQNLHAIYYACCENCQTFGPTAQHRKDTAYNSTVGEAIEEAKRLWNKRKIWTNLEKRR
jgi:inhibitor of KinA sporulation pathway (predicted exonuclease)